MFIQPLWLKSVPMTIKKKQSGRSGVIKCEKFVFAPKGNKVINFGYSLGGKDGSDEFVAGHEDKQESRLKEPAQVPVVEPVAESINVAEDGGVPVVNADFESVNVTAGINESSIADQSNNQNTIDSIVRPKTPDNQVNVSVASPNTPVEVKKMRGLVISEDGVMTMPSVHYYKLRRWEADLAVKEQQLKEVEHNLHVLVENSKQSVIAEANEAMGRFMAQEAALREQLLMEFAMLRDNANAEFNREVNQERQEKMALMKEIEYLRKAQFREMLETGDGNNVNEFQYAVDRMNRQQYNRVEHPLYYKSMDCEPIISPLSSHSNSSTSFPPIIHPMQHIYAREQPVQMAEVVQEGKSGGGVMEYLKEIPAKLVGSMLFGSSVGTRSPPKKEVTAQIKPDLSKLIGSSGNGDLPPTASLHDIFNPSNASYSETKPITMAHPSSSTNNSMSDGGMSRKRSEPDRSTIKPTTDNANAKPAVNLSKFR